MTAKKIKTKELRMLSIDGEVYFECPGTCGVNRTYLAGFVLLDDLRQWQDDAKKEPEYLEKCDFIGRVLAKS